MDSIPERVLEIWWAYYQCEPFGSHWEQAAAIAATVHANTAAMAATHGVKMEPISVVDFLPGDAVPWRKRSKLKNNRITHPKVHTQIIRQAFGFS